MTLGLQTTRRFWAGPRKIKKVDGHGAISRTIPVGRDHPKDVHHR